MKISFSLQSGFVATASSAAYAEYEPLLNSFGFGSIHNEPFGGGTMRAQVRITNEDSRLCFNQSKDDWSGGSEWMQAMRANALAAGATIAMQERSREGKTVYAGTWNDRKYELTVRRSIGCKESAYFAELSVSK